MPNAAQLTRDPVFQVNSCLWLVWQSTAGDQTYYAAGFLLRALGKRLAVPPAFRTRFAELGWNSQPPAPDLLLKHVTSGKHLVLECKATSFSVRSTTAQQARKLLSLCADPNCCAGAKGALIVVYVIDSEDTELQLRTLKELSGELSRYNLKCADSGTLALSIESGSLWATLTLLSPGKHDELRPIERRVRVVEGVGGDVRPLYIIPFDPAAADNQHPEEREYCARQLTERILNFATGAVGRASVPDIVSIDPVEVIRQATFGVSDRWVGNDVETLRKRVENELLRVLTRGMGDEKVEIASRKINVHLMTHEDQRTAISLLQKARPQYVAQRLLDPQLSLLEEGSEGSD